VTVFWTTVYNFRNTHKTNIENEQHDDCANTDENLCKVKFTIL